MRTYSYSIAAVNIKGTWRGPANFNVQADVATTVGVLEAPSPHRAQTMAKVAALRTYPAAEGWQGHTIAVMVNPNHEGRYERND